MEVWLKTTHLGESRVCIRFERRPENTLLTVIKRHRGRYRRGNAGERSCWYIPVGCAAALAQDLLTRHHQLADQINALLNAPAPVASPPAPAVPSPQAASPPAQAAATSRHTRQRRSGRIPPTQECFACLFEVRELRRIGRFVESPVPHNCGF